MAGEAEVSLPTVFARMRVISQEFRHFREVGVENRKSIELDLDGRAHHGDLLEVPLTTGAQVAAVSGHHPVGGTVCLPRIDLVTVLLMFRIENLNFTHPCDRGLADARVADRQTVVTGGR